MAITNYTELKASIADWLNRTDLTAQIPDFISLSEARLNRILRVREMITRRMTQTSNQYVAMPGDFLEVYQLELDPGSKNAAGLQYIGPNEMARNQANSLTGPTRYYTIIDGAFELNPAPTSGTTTLYLTYYAKIPALAEDNLTNWLLTKAPDLYLFMSLSHAAPYLNNDERIPVWSQMASSAFDELTMDSERAMRSRTQLTARRRGF